MDNVIADASAAKLPVAPRFRGSPAGPSGAWLQGIQEQGFAVVTHAVPEDWVASLSQEVDQVPAGEPVRRRENTYGIRNLFDLVPDVCRLAAAPEIRRLVEPVLGPDCFAVRATFFDKVPDANWKLRYHQDSVIAVKERREVAGFRAWAEKAGALQVRPPADVLRGMLAVRVHLDDCPAENGALTVLAGSHRQRWQRTEYERCRQQCAEYVCAVPRCGALLMRPLLLHASGPSRIPGHRRVIHLEFACEPLPGGLQWKHRIA